MKSRYLLEISVESVEAAVAAERGGADRLEFCSNASEGGTTPTPELLNEVRKRVRIPILSMNRPRAGSFVYSEPEFEDMVRAVDTAKSCGMDGIVLGLLRADGLVDTLRGQRLVERAKPLSVTFHRAFDECTDLRGALEAVVQTGATRVLTSGGRPTAPAGFDVLRELVQQAGNRLIVLPGSGIHAGNVREAVQKTEALEYHAGLSSVVARPAERLADFEAAVRELAEILASCA